MQVADLTPRGFQPPLPWSPRPRTLGARALRLQLANLWPIVVVSITVEVGHVRGVIIYDEGFFAVGTPTHCSFALA